MAGSYTKVDFDIGTRAVLQKSRFSSWQPRRPTKNLIRRMASVPPYNKNASEIAPLFASFGMKLRQELVNSLIPEKQSVVLL